jgi:transcriptional regulator with XRE-family HTH domain
LSSLATLVSERIRELRNIKGLSQEQLALKSDLNTSFIGAIERGIKKPTVETLDKIIKALDMSVQEFFNFELDYSKNDKSEVLIKLNYLLKDYSINEQTTIYNLVKQIVSFKNQP